MKKLVLLSILGLFLGTSCVTRVVTRTPATKIVVVKHPPRHYKTVMIRGHKYYYWNGKYHRKTTRGYVTVKI